MKIIKRTLIFLAMFTIFSSNTFADQLKLKCNYFLDNKYSYIANIFLDTTKMTGSINHIYFPTNNLGHWTYKEFEGARKRIDNISTEIYTNGDKYWFGFFGYYYTDLYGEVEYTFRYRIDRKDLSLDGGLYIQYLGGHNVTLGKCTIVENTTLI
jgi:hypothetical protein